MVSLGYTESGSGNDVAETEKIQEKIQEEATPPPLATPTQENLVTNTTDETISTESSEVSEPTPSEETPSDVVANPVKKPEAPKEPKPKVMQEALWNKNSDQTNKGNSEEDQGMDGITDGNPLSDTNGPESKGLSDKGKGKGANYRSPIYPDIENECNETGFVNIIFTVDADGNVISAKPISEGSSLTSDCAMRHARKIALALTFAADSKKEQETFEMKIEFLLK
jgi:outer membrane biosynthesis protein TonB